MKINVTVKDWNAHGSIKQQPKLVLKCLVRDCVMFILSDRIKQHKIPTVSHHR